MTSRTVVAGQLQPCCQEADNLVLVEQRPELEVRGCAVCGRKHYRAFLQPLDLAAKPKPLGA